MEWKEFFKINKKHLLIRIIIVIITFLLFYWVSHYLVPYSGIPLSEFFFLSQAFYMLTYYYLPVELGIFLIRLYLFIEFKAKMYFAIFYLLFFISLNIFWGFGNGKYDGYFFIGGFLFLIFLMGLIISFFKKKQQANSSITQKSH